MRESSSISCAACRVYVRDPDGSSSSRCVCVPSEAILYPGQRLPLWSLIAVR